METQSYPYTLLLTASDEQINYDMGIFDQADDLPIRDAC